MQVEYVNRYRKLPIISPQLKSLPPLIRTATDFFIYFQSFKERNIIVDYIFWLAVYLFKSYFLRRVAPPPFFPPIFFSIQVG